jgi:hypothetical protein
MKTYKHNPGEPWTPATFECEGWIVVTVNEDSSVVVKVLHENGEEYWEVKFSTEGAFAGAELRDVGEAENPFIDQE